MLFQDLKKIKSVTSGMNQDWKELEISGNPISLLGYYNQLSEHYLKMV